MNPSKYTVGLFRKKYEGGCPEKNSRGRKIQ